MSPRTFPRVEVTAKFPSPEDPAQFTEQTRQANFHVWAYRFGKRDDPAAKPGTVETVGLVELDCGRIRLIRPERIRFLREAKP